MRGALQIVLLLFTSVRIQKGILIIGAALMVVGYLLPRPGGSILVVLGFICPLVATLLTSGVLTRSVLAPKSFRLIPRAREQVLGGMALLTVIVATASTLVAWSLGVGTSLLPMLWLQIAAGISVLLITQFLLMTSFPGMMVWFALCGGLPQLLHLPATRELARTLVKDPVALIAIIAVAWVGFGLWFLRAPSFRAPPEPYSSPKPVRKVEGAQSIALRAYLLGNPSLRIQFTSSFAAAAIVIIVWGFIGTVTHTLGFGVNAFTQMAGLVLCIGTIAGLGGWLVVKRSKFLWLRGGLDRVEMFRLCEREAWKYYGAMASSTFVSLAIVWIVEPSIGVAYTILLAYYLCVGAGVLYLGLMHVRGWRALDVLCAIVLFVMWARTYGVTLSAVDRPAIGPGIIVGLALGATALRFIALHRWRTIDWLVCKPPRSLARDARAGR